MELLYIGSRGGMEKKMIEKIEGISYKDVLCGKLRRYFSLKNFVDFFRVPLGILQARQILREFKPDVVFSKGGYVSFPVVFSARALKIPVILHESDLNIGLANKLCMKWANKVLLSFEETDAEGEFVGALVREEILTGDRRAGLRFLKFNDYKPIVLIMGGSQGAEQINGLVRASLDELLKKFQIVHLVGRGNLDISVKHSGYAQFEYLDEEMADVYAASDLVISRGGANSLFELALLKKNAVIIPLSLEASRGDQIDNAKVFIDKYKWSMLSGKISREDFIEAIEEANSKKRDNIPELKNGLKKIVDLILNFKK